MLSSPQTPHFWSFHKRHIEKCVEISSSCNGLTEMAILLPSPSWTAMLPAQAKQGAHQGSKWRAWRLQMLTTNCDANPCKWNCSVFFQSHQVEIQKCMSTTTWGWMKGLQDFFIRILIQYVYVIEIRALIMSHLFSSVAWCLTRRLPYLQWFLSRCSYLTEERCAHNSQSSPIMFPPAQNRLSLSSILTTLDGWSDKHQPATWSSPVPSYTLQGDHFVESHKLTWCQRIRSLKRSCIRAFNHT